MSKAYIIEVRNRTAGIVAGDEHGFHFFSSERTFDRLEGRAFRSARDAERAAKVLLDAKRHLAGDAGQTKYESARQETIHRGFGVLSPIDPHNTLIGVCSSAEKI